MADVNAEQRQKAKTAAANAAVECNDVAVAFGVAGIAAATAGALSGAGAPAGALVGGVLGVASFGAWWVGNRYQRLANDPPRSDYATVTVSNAQSTLPGQSAPDAATAASLISVNQLVLGDALDALVTSLERYDGAVADGAQDAVQLQVEAVRQNASLVAATQQIIADLCNSLNAAWAQIQVDLTNITLDALTSNYLTSAGPPHQAQGTALQTALSQVTDLSNSEPFTDLDASADPVLALTAVPAAPGALYTAALFSAMTDLGAALLAIVEVSPSVA